MKLLIITQKMNTHDPVLGFFHRWVAEFSKHFKKITVICLEEGEHSLPAHVAVVSLGKEKKQSRMSYVANLFKIIWRERGEYDAVFVHMNQEYVLLAGWLWKLWKKKIYMWRNHHAGTVLTDIAAAFCTNIFCTSKFSYTAKFKKTVFMPVGIDTNAFRKTSAEKKPHSVLFLARIAPIKKPDVLIRAVKMLRDAGIAVQASICGDPLPKDQAYYDSLKELVREPGLESFVQLHPGVPHDQTVSLYNAHDIFVNLSTSGMYDKTIFEAMACESLSLASNRNLEGEVDDMFIFEEGNVEQLAHKLEALLALAPDAKAALGASLRQYVLSKHSLESLAQKLSERLS